MTAKPVLTLKRPKRDGKRPAANGTRGRGPGAGKATKDIKGPKITKGPKATKAKGPEAPQPRAVSDEEMLAELSAVAPDLWNPETPVPLAIGIHKQLYPIAERMDVSRRSLRKFLSRWTSSRAYQRALSEPGAQRVNLDGSPAGEVTGQHSDSARQRVGNE